MKYSRKARFISPKTALWLAVLVVAIGVLFTVRVFFPSAYIMLWQPVISLGNALTSATYIISTSWGAVSERDRLVEENNRLLIENEMLRETLGNNQEDEGVFASVTLRPPMAPYDTLILNKGSEEGIHQGAIVYKNAIPIGTIASVGGHSAHVLLYSASGNITEGWAGEARIPVSFVGGGAGTFTALVPREVPLVVGDTVYFPGGGEVVAGSIQSIEDHPSSPSKKLVIAPYVNPFSVTSVRVVLP